MAVTPWLNRIRVYPVKSLDGKNLEAIRVNGGAGLALDREYRFVDDDGRVVNSKRCGAALIPIRSWFDIVTNELTLEDEGSSVQAIFRDWPWAIWAGPVGSG